MADAPSPSDPPSAGQPDAQPRPDAQQRQPEEPADAEPTGVSDQPPDSTAQRPVAPPAAAPEARRPGWRAWEVAAFLELVALCGFVIAQPVLDATGRSPDFFLFYRAGAWDIVALILLVTVAPPVVLWGLAALTRLAGARARRAVHVALLGALLVLLAIEVGKHAVSLRGLPLAAAAAVAGVALTVLYVRVPALGQFLRFAAVGPVVFAVVFVFTSPSGALVRQGTGESAGDAPANRVAAGVNAAPQTHPTIVMILLDELPLAAMLDREGNIDAELYPNIAELASRSHLFRNATAASGTSPLAIPAMLSGRNPVDRVAPHYAEYPENLFTLLGPTHAMNVHESITLLCPPEYCPYQHRPGRSGLPAVVGESADLLRQVVSPQESNVDPIQTYAEPTEAEARRERLGAEFRFDQLGANQPARFQEFASRLEPSPEPTLHYLHLLLPHAPWRYLPSGLQYEVGPRLTQEGPASDRTEWWLRISRQRLQLQMSYTDRLVGEIVQTLEDKGMYDQSAVVLAADHGVSLRPHTPARYLPDGPDDSAEVLDAAAELLWVPLIVKEPGQETGVVDDRNVQLVDMLPTLADLAGVEVPWETDGLSALGPPRSEQEKTFLDDPGEVRTIDGARGQALVLGGLRDDEPVRPELVGLPLDDFTVTDSGMTAQVIGLEAFQDVAPDSGTVPAFVSGTVPGDTPPGDVVIAVNGRIGAVSTLTDAFEDRRWFAGLVVDDETFVPGANELEVLLLTDDGRLERLELEAAPEAE